jgi:hypothetical protein
LRSLVVSQGFVRPVDQLLEAGALAESAQILGWEKGKYAGFEDDRHEGTFVAELFADAFVSFVAQGARNGMARPREWIAPLLPVYWRRRSFVSNAFMALQLD